MSIPFYGYCIDGPLHGYETTLPLEAGSPPRIGSEIEIEETPGSFRYRYRIMPVDKSTGQVRLMHVPGSTEPQYVEFDSYDMEAPGAAGLVGCVRKGSTEPTRVDVRGLDAFYSQTPTVMSRADIERAKVSMADQWLDDEMRRAEAEYYARSYARLHEHTGALLPLLDQPEPPKKRGFVRETLDQVIAAARAKRRGQMMNLKDIIASGYSLLVAEAAGLASGRNYGKTEVTTNYIKHMVKRPAPDHVVERLRLRAIEKRRRRKYLFRP